MLKRVSVGAGKDLVITPREILLQYIQDENRVSNDWIVLSLARTHTIVPFLVFIPS